MTKSLKGHEFTLYELVYDVGLQPSEFRVPGYRHKATRILPPLTLVIIFRLSQIAEAERSLSAPQQFWGFWTWPKL
jgi:hypothetical protein